MTISKFISQQLNINFKSVQNTINLLNEDCTVPFIARYRKELTQNLDEIAIFEIQKHKKQFEELEKRKDSIVKALEEQGVLTDELKQKINDTYDATTLEDIYLPYKKKRKTKAETARKNGLEPLAKQIMAQRNNDIELTAETYINDKVPDATAALEGARFIIAEWINENIWVRNYLRRVLKKSASIKTKIIKSKENDEKAQKYQDYFDWEEPISRCPSHRLLAMLRAEKEGFIRLKLNVDKDMIFDKLDNRFIKTNNSSAEQIEMAITDAYKRLLEPSIGTETINYYKQQADKQSVKVFSENLKQLLLSSPLGEKNVLGIDPGYRTGCKIVCINQQGDLLHNDTIYPHPPQKDRHGAIHTIKWLVDKYNIEAIAIGNGTASRETEQLVKNIKFDKKTPIFVVSEAGASIYSASKVAREEFPDKDVTVRGAVSIARRLQDPLAELVKIDAKSIGVGQYQHDVDQQLLKEELDTTVVSSVNLIGVNVNTASKHLLKYVSGIGEKLAENIVNYRSKNGSIKSKTELKKVKRLGDKAFEQSAGFLRIKNGTNPLDNSAVHPESYTVVKQMAKHLGVKVDEIIGNKELLSKIQLNDFISEKTGLLTLKDIIKELLKPGVDIREKAKVFEFSPDLKDINDVKVGEYYPGIINNITNFGCFVDIGIKESGLVHISNLAKQFVSNPNEIVKLNQSVTAKVISIDITRKRIGLSLVE